jgi:hypothetical protein
MAVQYKIAGGEPTRKWKYSAGSGAGVGGVVGVIASYFIAKADPTMPNEVLAAIVWLITWLLTQGAMMLAGYLVRPSPQDRPVLDPGAGPPLTEEELRGALRSRRPTRGR